jgi:mannose-6-phosphate isomerase class I
LRGGTEERFPLLVKLIDSSEPLSVQVHPDDALAQELEHEAYGKTEVWHILESRGGHVGLGFVREPAERTADWLRGPEMPGLLRRLEVEAGDFVFVPGGEIHYIGPGVLLLEVQQTSDLTYRIHDWGRSSRELHLDKAARALRWEPRRDRELLERDTPQPLRAVPSPFRLERIQIAERRWLRAQQCPLIFVPLDGWGQIVHAAGTWEVQPYRAWLLPERTEAELWPSGTVTGVLCTPDATWGAAGVPGPGASAAPSLSDEP